MSIKVGAEGVYSNQGAEDQCLQEVFDFYLELLPPYYLIERWWSAQGRSSPEEKG